MHIGYFVDYRGHIGSIEYDEEDKLLYGKITDIKDFVNYHANSIIDLEKHYKEAVDDYIDLKKEIETNNTAINLTEEQFYNTHCKMCGSQRCEGVGTEWFDACKFKEYLAQTRS